MRLWFASVFFLVFGAVCFALAIVSLGGAHRHTHWRRVMILVGAGIVLATTGGRLLARAIAQRRKTDRPA
jgi:hypothetical protein